MRCANFSHIDCAKIENIIGPGSIDFFQIWATDFSKLVQPIWLKFSHRVGCTSITFGKVVKNIIQVPCRPGATCKGPKIVKNSQNFNLLALLAFLTKLFKIGYRVSEPNWMEIRFATKNVLIVKAWDFINFEATWKTVIFGTFFLFFFYKKLGHGS